jgi:homoserine kinase type II
MAVYTEVSFEDAARLVARLGLGDASAMQGIRGGIENTNYFVDTPRGRFVLTVFERLGFDELPYYLHLMKHLASRGLPVPEPKADAAGAILHTLQGKPAAVVDCLRGSHRLAPDASHCAALGNVLARLHRAGADFSMQQPNLRGLAWWAETAPVVLPFVSAAQRGLLSGELAYQQTVAGSAAFASLPRGAIHADLFRDNVMFDPIDGADRLTGVFDFYFAGVDTFLFDLAVCVNDWACDPDTGRLDELRANALVRAYDAVRRLNSSERRLMPAMLRAAALRFWLSRLWDLHLPRDATLLAAHDPGHFERVLRERVQTPWHPPAPDAADSSEPPPDFTAPAGAADTEDPARP